MSAEVPGLERPHVPAIHQYLWKIWFGMTYSTWQRTLLRNRFAMGACYLHLLPLITLSSVRNSMLFGLEQAVWGRRIEQTKLADHPLFVIGHWRSGTTFLHELLDSDDEFTAPNTYQCFFPDHFLISERYGVRLLRFTLPAQRLADSVPLGWRTPNEDEFALCMMGAPSPYRVLAFPNRPGEPFTLEDLSPRELDLWKKSLTRFLKRLTLRHHRRIVLKSPTHTYRLRTLLDMFPRAQFVHIVRNPFEVFRSTVHMNKVAYLLHGLQYPTFQGLEESVLENFLLMHRKLDEARSVLTPANFYEVRYEDLVNNPMGEMRRVYERLGLGDFDHARPGLDKFLSGRAGYHRSPEPLSDFWRARVAERWGPIIDRYGYD